MGMPSESKCSPEAEALGRMVKIEPLIVSKSINKPHITECCGMICGVINSMIGLLMIAFVFLMVTGFLGWHNAFGIFK